MSKKVISSSTYEDIVTVVLGEYDSKTINKHKCLYAPNAALRALLVNVWNLYPDGSRARDYVISIVSMLVSTGYGNVTRRQFNRLKYYRRTMTALNESLRPG